MEYPEFENINFRILAYENLINSKDPSKERMAHFMEPKLGYFDLQHFHQCFKRNDIEQCLQYVSNFSFYVIENKKQMKERKKVKKLVNRLTDLKIVLTQLQYLHSLFEKYDTTKSIELMKSLKQLINERKDRKNVEKRTNDLLWMLVENEKKEYEKKKEELETLFEDAIENWFRKEKDGWKKWFDEKFCKKPIVDYQNAIETLKNLIGKDVNDGKDESDEEDSDDDDDDGDDDDDDDIFAFSTQKRTTGSKRKRRESDGVVDDSSSSQPLRKKRKI